MADRHRLSRRHLSGYVIHDRSDGLNWLECTACGREWAENDRGTHVRGSKVCTDKEHQPNDLWLVTTSS